MSSSTQNSYFVPGYGISRFVIQEQIRWHCGPEAIARPYVHYGRDGFLITTPGKPLTKEQIQDLRDESKKYEEQQAAAHHAHADEETTELFINEPVPVGQRKRSG
ncbi:hypothetical protein B0A49_07031 [Cryomyces minteri]|uniref:Uncharacterized protein n=1 Tax=Cryomyces minteri TaxID=331657 RepID=A0A4U0XIV3_9PEZI|nr:hypothetical protein B0A49_07031 [Cryomyces minteri]